MDTLPNLDQLDPIKDNAFTLMVLKELRACRTKIAELESTVQVLVPENEELRAAITKLESTNQALILENKGLRGTIKKLKGQLAKHSDNSSKPPSSDGYKKPSPRSQRGKSDRKPGGQPGHEGSTLRQSSDPDVVENHVELTCQHCQLSLAGISSEEDYEVRQVTDIPLAKVTLTEHRSFVTTCPVCGHRNKGRFPNGITQPAQYSSTIKALAVYYSQCQLIPYARLKNLFRDVHGVMLSQGTIYNANLACHHKLEAFDRSTQEAVMKSPVAHFDESGLRVKKKLHWLHVASTPKLTHYAMHEKRGCAAMADIGILPMYRGHAVHDHWLPYFKYACRHSLCNSHYLRELRFHSEHHEQAWCEKMYAHLLLIKKTVDESKAWGKQALPTTQSLGLQKTYHTILNDGLAEIPTLPVTLKKRGKRKQHPSKNLWDRLSNFHMETLAFMLDFTVPFTNNQAEQDIRMMKVKQKISGCFRDPLGAKMFCRTRGYISTMRKQGKDTLESIARVFSLTEPILCPTANDTS